jgi:putative nucleotidyltransferase-like protein
MPQVSLPAENASDRKASSVVDRQEFELLLACCALDCEVANKGTLSSLLNQTLDWEKFYELASFHNVEPLTYSRLLSHSHQLPEAVAHKIQRDSIRHAQRSLLLTRELLRILHTLAERQVAAIPFKGPALAQTAYGDVSLRQFSDLDVLIRPHDCKAAAIAIASLGYQPSSELRSEIESEWIRTGYERSFDGPLGKNVLELQWRLLPRFYAVDIEVEEFASRASEIDLCGDKVETLSSEDQLLALSIHASKHAWMRLGWIVDIARIATTTPIDFALARERARELGVVRIVAVSLWLANSLLGCKIPEEFVDAVADQETRKIGAVMQGIVMQGTDYPTETMAYFWLMLALRERRSDRAKFIWRLLTTPSQSEWESVRLPSVLFPLYRVIRLGRLGRRVLGL